MSSNQQGNGGHAARIAGITAAATLGAVGAAGLGALGVGAAKKAWDNRAIYHYGTLPTHGWTHLEQYAFKKPF